MKKRGLITVAVCFVAALVFLISESAFAALRVNVMPSGFYSKVNSWDSGPYTWPGNSLELWGNVAYDGTGALTYTWVFGAGEGTASGTVTNRKNIAASHTYAATGSYIATLTVTDGVETDTDTVYLDVVPVSAEVRTNLAIQRALKYIYMNTATRVSGGFTFAQPNSGNWGYTPMAIIAMENHGHLESNDFNGDIFAEYVQYLINDLSLEFRAMTATMDNTTFLDSDLNGNARKVYISTNDIYHIGLSAMALAATITPDATFRACANASVSGRTYNEVLQDLVDYIAFAQRDYSNGLGGWRYTANYGNSDNSVSQWPALALGEAERAPWNINAPGWVKARLQSWLNFSQHVSTGGFGYNSTDWLNVAKTGAGIAQIIYAGGGGNLSNAIAYINNNWGRTTYDYGNIGDHYAMYGVKKGLEYANLRLIGAHDWQEEYNAWYVANARNNATNGYYWNSSVRINTGYEATCFALLVMAPLEVCKPIAIAGSDRESTEGASIAFNGSASTHTCPGNYGIALYEWDFNYDGINFDVDATGSVATNAAGYTITNGTETQTFTVALRVTDTQLPAKISTDTLIVTVSNGNISPHAVPGGPYLGGIGEDITLDGSASYDDNAEGGLNPIYNTAKDKFDEIELYQWDIDGDGLYGSSDSPAEPEGPVAIVNFGPDFMGTKNLSLKVTDSFGASASQSNVVTTVAVSDLYPISYQLVSRTFNRRTGLWDVTWRVSVRNDGTGAAMNVSATISPASVTPGVSVIDGSVSFDGSVDPGETQVSTDTFRYTYPRTDMNLTTMTWDIEFTDAMGTRHVIRSIPQ